MCTRARHRTMEPSGLKTEQKTPHCVTDFKEIPFSIPRSMTLLNMQLSYWPVLHLVFFLNTHSVLLEGL